MSLLFPVLDFVPDFENAPRYSIGAEVDRMAITAAPSLATFPTTEPDRVFGFNFVLDTIAEIRAFKAFFSDRAGKCRLFYLPSWRDDLEIISGSGDALVVKPVTWPGNMHADHFARTLFLFHAGALHVTQWIKQTTTGTETTFQLADALPWPVSALDMAGWVHLARFADDRLAWRHKLPDAAELAVSFRASRQWAGVPCSGAIDPIPFNRSPGFGAYASIENTLPPRDYRASYAMGPDTLHTPVGASWARWAAWINQDGTCRLKPLIGTITRPDNTGTVADLPIVADAQRIALAFSRTGNEFLAFGKDETITVAWHTGTASWAGMHPVMTNNFFTDTGMPIAESEPVCFYIKPGANVLFARYASENFGTEHVAALLPFGPLELRGIDELGFATLQFADTSFRLTTLSNA